MMSRRNLLLSLLSLLASLSAGGQAFVFSPQWTAQAQFAGYYVAMEMGFYAEEGLNVEIVHPSSTQSAIEKFQKKECDAATLPLSLAMRSVDEGLPLVNILQTSMNSASMLISRWGSDPMTLKGAKVATVRAGFGQLSRCVADLEGLDYQWIPLASCVNLFVAGAVDATLARSYNEYYQLLETGTIEPEGKGIYRFRDHGYNIQQEGVYVTRAYYQKHADEAERFARASRRGWEWAAEHPEETLDIVMKYVNRYRIATNRVLQQLMLEEVLRLQLDPDTGERAFRLRTDMVEKASQLMSKAGMLKRTVKYEDLMP